MTEGIPYPPRKRVTDAWNELMRSPTPEEANALELRRMEPHELQVVRDEAADLMEKLRPTLKRGGPHPGLDIYNPVVTDSKQELENRLMANLKIIHEQEELSRKLDNSERNL